MAVIALTCVFHLRLLFIVIPRAGKVLMAVNMFQWVIIQRIVKFVRIRLVGIVRTLHFETLKSNFHVCDHLKSVWMSFCIMLWSSLDDIGLCHPQINGGMTGHHCQCH